MLLFFAVVSAIKGFQIPYHSSSLKDKEDEAKVADFMLFLIYAQRK